jgi:hypothetical protein
MNGIQLGKHGRKRVGHGARYGGVAQPPHATTLTFTLLVGKRTEHVRLDISALATGVILDGFART